MRDIPTSPRIIEIKKARRVYTIRLVFLFIILFASIVFALSFYSNNKSVTIDKIVITGTQVINPSEIEQNIKENISGKYFRLFSKSNIFIYPHDFIYDSLVLNFPKIEKLRVYREGLRTLRVDIFERVGSYLYCGNSVPEEKDKIGENCFFINEEGFIFDKAPYFSGDVYFKYYSYLGDENINPLGKQVTDIDKFEKLSKFINGVTDLGFNPVYLVIGQDGISSLYLEHNDTDTSPVILFKNESNLDVVLDNLSLSMKKKEFINEINSKYNKLLYIDLKFKNKVLYKFQ
jgi:hypothetical protein